MFKVSYQHWNVVYYKWFDDLEPADNWYRHCVLSPQVSWARIMRGENILAEFRAAA